MSQTENYQPVLYKMPMEVDIEEHQPVIHFEDQAESQLLNRIDALRDGIAKIAMLADDSSSVIDICSELLSEV